MEIKNLFKKKSLPENDGNDGDYIDKYYLSFPSLDGEPSYELDTTLVIGSSIGDIIIPDDNVSSKHCTITLNQDVVSLMDHSSIDGTFINKKKIVPGRFFILQESDKLRLGKLEFLLEKISSPVFDKTQEINLADFKSELDDTIPDLPADATQVTKVMNPKDIENKLEPKVVEDSLIDINDAIEDTFEDEFEDDDDPQASSLRDEASASADQKLKEAPVNIVVSNRGVVKSANSLIRVLAILADTLIVFILMEFIAGQPAVDALVADVGNIFIKYLSPLYKEHLEAIVNQALSDIPALKVMVEELLSFFKSQSRLGEGVFLFFSLRILGGLLLGVSFGQFLLGNHSTSNQLLRRLQGTIREIVGIITFPFFFIFDVMTLFSKRSFKEVLTFSQIESSGKMKSLLLILIFIPLLVSLYLITPMLQGFDFKSPVFSTFLDFKKDKVVEQIEVNAQSIYMGLEGDLSGFIALPKYNIIQKNGRKSLNSQIQFINSETKKVITLEKAKSFSLKKLLYVGISSNYMANKNYGLIHTATKDIAHDNKNFKATSFQSTSFHNQVLELTRASFNLSIETLPEHVMKYGPFLRSYIAYRNSLDQIIEEEIISIENTALGRNSLILFKTPSGISFFDLTTDKTQLYKTNIKTLKDFRRFFKRLSFKDINPGYLTTDFNSLIAMDFLANPDKINANFYQLYYEYLYKTSTELLNSEDERLVSRLIQSNKSILKAVEVLKRDDASKFVQNMSDLIKALVDRDSSYFGTVKYE